MIDLKRMFGLLDRTGFAGPVNIHYEHNNLLGTDLGTWQLPIPRERFIAIVSKDLQFVRSQTGAADGRNG